MKPLPREQVRAVYLNLDLHRQLSIVAATEDRPMRALAEEALEHYLADKQIPIKDWPRIRETQAEYK